VNFHLEARSVQAFFFEMRRLIAVSRWSRIGLPQLFSLENYRLSFALQVPVRCFLAKGWERFLVSFRARKFSRLFFSVRPTPLSFLL